MKGRPVKLLNVMPLMFHAKMEEGQLVLRWAKIVSVIVMILYSKGISVKNPNNVIQEILTAIMV